MKVSIIDYTKEAESILIFSKNTRLKMSSDAFDEIKKMSEEDKSRELAYIFGTIKGSLEFVDFTIMIEGVTRAFTHQLVRHRVGVSFAQQSQRVVNASEFEYLASSAVLEDPDYHSAMEDIKNSYCKLIEKGIKPEDARGILPTNILTNILVKINLRALSELMSQRLCNRTQEEFRCVAREIKNKVVAIYPWTETLLRAFCEENKRCFYKNGKGCGKWN